MNTEQNNEQDNEGLNRFFHPGSFFHRFFSEKEIPTDIFEVTDKQGVLHLIETDYIVECISLTKGAERSGIEKIIRQIDFHNGDITHFFAHLAQGLVSAYDQT